MDLATFCADGRSKNAIIVVVEEPSPPRERILTERDLVLTSDEPQLASFGSHS